MQPIIFSIESMFHFHESLLAKTTIFGQIVIHGIHHQGVIPWGSLGSQEGDLLHSVKEGVPAALRNVDLSSLLCLGWDCFMTCKTWKTDVTLVRLWSFFFGWPTSLNIGDEGRNRTKETKETNERRKLRKMRAKWFHSCQIIITWFSVGKINFESIHPWSAKDVLVSFPFQGSSLVSWWVCQLWNPPRWAVKMEKTTTTWFWVDILKKSHYFQPCFFFLNLNLGEKVFRAVIWICNFFQMKIIWKWRNLEIQVLTNWFRGPCQAWSLVRWYLYLLLSSSVFWEGIPQSFKYASVHFKGPGYHKTPSNSFPRWWLSETGIFCDEIWITVTLCEDTKKGD